MPYMSKPMKLVTVWFTEEEKAFLDELAKKVRGIDELEARLVKLEKEVAALKKAKTPARRQAPRKPASP